MTSIIIHNSSHSCYVSINFTKYTSSSSVNAVGRPRVLDDSLDIRADNVPLGIFAIYAPCLELHSPPFIFSIAFNSSPSLFVDTFRLRMYVHTITNSFLIDSLILTLTIYTQFRTMQSNGSYLLTDDIFPDLRRLPERKLVERQLDVVNWSQRQLIITTIGRMVNWSHIEE